MSSVYPYAGYHTQVIEKVNSCWRQGAIFEKEAYVGSDLCATLILNVEMQLSFSLLETNVMLCGGCKSLFTHMQLSQ